MQAVDFISYCQCIDATVGKRVQQMIDKVKHSKVPNKTMRKAFEMQGMKLYFVVCKNPDLEAKEKLIFLVPNKINEKEYKSISLFRHEFDYLVCRTPSFEQFILYILQ